MLQIITFFQNTFILRRPGVASFADIISCNQVENATFKDSKEM